MIPRQSEKPKVVPNKYIPSSVQIVPNLSQLLQISSKLVSKLLQVVITNHVVSEQGGSTWQAFGRGKNGHETFRQARIYNFHDKCVVFARNLKFSNLTQ